MEPPFVDRQTVKMKPTVEYKYYYRSKRRPNTRPNKTTKLGFSVTQAQQLAYLNKIKVPPTYEQVILSLNSQSRLQGTGYDGTGQLQYFYSPDILAERTKDKYCNLVNLGQNLQKIRRDIDRLLQSTQITQQVLNALALKVMFVCNFRIGNPKNETYGLTTINGDHLTMKKSQTWIKFVGKKKQWNLCLIKDEQIIAFLKRLAKNYRQLDKKGQQASTNTLFSWNGYQVTPQSLNNFLANYHPEITSKTWRTWYANVEFIRRIMTIQIPITKRNRQKAKNTVIKTVAKDLHHTPAISKKNYLMKELVTLYVDQPDDWRQINKKTRGADKFFLAFLKKYCQN